jgi:hypothetical protein
MILYIDCRKNTLGRRKLGLGHRSWRIGFGSHGFSGLRGSGQKTPWPTGNRVLQILPESSAPTHHGWPKNQTSRRSGLPLGISLSLPISASLSPDSPLDHSLSLNLRSLSLSVSLSLFHFLSLSHSISVKGKKGREEERTKKIKGRRLRKERREEKIIRKKTTCCASCKVFFFNLFIFINLLIKLT